MRALYATCELSNMGRTAKTVTFRIGLPASDAVITARHQRFDRAQYHNRRRLAVMHNGRSYPVRSHCLEIRDTDSDGRGLGAERHHTAVKVPVGALHILPDAPHELNIYVNRRWTATPKWGCTLVTGRREAFIGYGAHPLTAAADARKRARFASAI